MFNTGLKWYETADIDNFTSNAGIKLRKAINGPWRKVLKLGISRKVSIEKYLDLEKKKAYIFCVNHSFDEDVISALYGIDRNVYVLHGTTHQMEHNPINWLRSEPKVQEERKEQLCQKMETKPPVSYPAGTWGLYYRIIGPVGRQAAFHILLSAWRMVRENDVQDTRGWRLKAFHSLAQSY